MSDTTRARSTRTRSRLMTRLASIGASLALIAGVGVSGAAHADPIGDGSWAPSHDESIAVIPLCKGPEAVGEWLDENFSDHGRDIDRYLERNWDVLTALATNQRSIVSTTVLLSYAVLQIPSYALTDSLFHLPPTALSLATGCGVIERTNSNPFSVRR